MWLHSLKVAQLLRSAACLHTNHSRSYLNHLVLCVHDTAVLNREKKKGERTGYNLLHLELLSSLIKTSRLNAEILSDNYAKSEQLQGGKEAMLIKIYDFELRNKTTERH